MQAIPDLQQHLEKKHGFTFHYSKKKKQRDISQENSTQSQQGRKEKESNKDEENSAKIKSQPKKEGEKEKQSNKEEMDEDDQASVVESFTLASILQVYKNKPNPKRNPSFQKITFHSFFQLFFSGNCLGHGNE